MIGARRYARQSRLAQVGPEGQRRISSAALRVESRGLEGEVQARYLVGSGVSVLSVPDEATARAAREVDASADVRVESSGPCVEWPLPFDLRNESARAIAAGAYKALIDLAEVVIGTR